MLHVWSEFAAMDRLLKPGVGELLAGTDCGLLLKVTADRLVEPSFLDGVARLATSGIPEVGLWLLLDEAAGYWPSERNVDQVYAALQRILQLALPAAWIALDLEPPLSQARRLARLSGIRGAAAKLLIGQRNLRPSQFNGARDRYAELIGMAHQGGLKVLCAAHDYLAEDAWLGRPVLQDLHEAPVLGLGWDLISIMLYGSLAGAPPEDTRRWLYDTALALRGQSIGASIGLTAPGILGNEPYYTSPRQLAADAGALKAAGVRHFALYSLEGILAGDRPEEWLRAVRDAPACVPPTSAWAMRLRGRRRAAALFWFGWRLLATIRAPRLESRRQPRPAARPGQ